MEDLLLKMQSKPIMKKFKPIEVAIQRLDEDELTSNNLIIKDMTENRYDVVNFMKSINEHIDVKEPSKEEVVQIVVDKPKAVKRKLKLKQNKNEGTAEGTVEGKDGPVRKISRPNKSQDDNGNDEIDDDDDNDLVAVADLIDTSKTSQNKYLTMEVSDFTVQDRLPVQSNPIVIQKDNYFMNNRKLFVKFINTIFQPYAEEIKKLDKTETCKSKKNKNFEMLTHQKIVRDYINLYTPYRGLLLYHGLGSGKTCSSISIAEGILYSSSIAMSESITSSKKIIVMTPASLRSNYFEELKKCGNPIYRKNQHWEFLKSENGDEYEEMLSSVMHLPKRFIRKYKGAYLVNVKKESNYDELSSEDKNILEEQLDEMIHSKFFFINYNGLRKDSLKKITKDDTINPFSNKVVIIDEAHNFISRIVNKIAHEKNMTKPSFLSTMMYKYLMDAENCRIVLLTGTPIINYPNEIAILFNILRGYIKTYEFTIESADSSATLNEKNILGVIHKINTMDYMNFENNVLTVTRNPFGSINNTENNKYKGVQLQNNIDDEKVFLSNIIKTLQINKFKVVRKKVTNHKALPDKLDDFIKLFINSDDGDVKNTDLLKKRILGLTSYLGDKENLMPAYDEETDYHIEKIEMSNHQFAKYEEVRNEERKRDKQKPGRKAKDALFTETSSSYRIFSRAYCNFVFPESIPRPFPKEKGLEESIDSIGDEDAIDALTNEQRSVNVDGRLSLDDIEEAATQDETETKTYAVRIKEALRSLKDGGTTYLNPGPDGLQKLSPKFLRLLYNIENEKNEGSHLIYSQFRTLEGIGILSLLLEANGYMQFKLKKNENNEYVIDANEDTYQKGKMFALYTGTETVEEKEIIRKIYNSEWDFLPGSMRQSLKKLHDNNFMGEVIKIFMITSAGAEGINLKNTRFVHITEPYWHPVREKQVIGRARRICSHEDLPEHLQNIKVFMYLMTFSDEQIKNASITLKKHDKSKYTKSLRPITTDEALFEISRKKESINGKLLISIREAAMDCSLYSTTKGSVECYSFGAKVNPASYGYAPDINKEEKDDKTMALNLKDEKMDFKKVLVDGKEYAMKFKNNKTTNELYTIDSYLKSKQNPKNELVFVGKRVQRGEEWIIDTTV